MKKPATLFALCALLFAHSLHAQTKKIPVAYSAVSATQSGF